MDDNVSFPSTHLLTVSTRDMIELPNCNTRTQ